MPRLEKSSVAGMENETYNCSMCPFYSNNRQKLFKHLIKRHRNAPNFIVHCSAVGCGASFKKEAHIMSIVIENIAKLGVIQFTMKMMKLTIPKQKTFLMMKLQLLIISLKENSQKLSIF